MGTVEPSWTVAGPPEPLWAGRCRVFLANFRLTFDTPLTTVVRLKDSLERLCNMCKPAYCANEVRPPLPSLSSAAYLPSVADCSPRPRSPTTAHADLSRRTQNCHKKTW